jgi:hypothetical protein
MDLRESILSLLLLLGWLAVVFYLHDVALFISYAVTGWVIGGLCPKVARFLLGREKI